MNCRPDGIYCDCTTGGGGHLAALVERCPGARFIAIDVDPEALAHARTRLADRADRVQFVNANYRDLGLILTRIQTPAVDGILFDLGVSYHQFTTPERGFSFDRDGPLSMQMDPRMPPLYRSLRDLTESEIIRILHEYGDVRLARRIGHAIHGARAKINTTMDLRAAVATCVPRRFLIKSLRQVFQAFRIWVNDELTSLAAGLNQAIAALRPAGRGVVISYHSGEDRVAKRVFIAAESAGMIRRLNKKVIRPGNEEVRRNPASRSARMRVVERCARS